MRNLNCKVLILLLWCNYEWSAASCVGRLVNPLTEICWSCLFPISIGKFRVAGNGNEDTENPGQVPCVCVTNGIPRIGLPIGFWEPVRLVDVTRTPYCMVGIGGIQLMKGKSNQGSRTSKLEKLSFYHVHYYIYPLIYWLELLMNFLCLECSGVDLMYMSELDPSWGDEEMSLILSPEAAIFANPIAQLACVADCAAASAGFSLDPLFWCAGCQGSMYPFSGYAPHVGGVQASMLLAQRIMYKLHRVGALWGTMGTDALCEGRFIMPIIRKSQYKLQMTYPVPATNKALGCHPLGRSDVLLSAGREFPVKGEDFGYLVWRKRNCCIL